MKLNQPRKFLRIRYTVSLTWLAIETITEVVATYVVIIFYDSID